MSVEQSPYRVSGTPGSTDDTNSTSTGVASAAPAAEALLDEHQLRQLLAILPCAVVVLNNRGRIQEANAAAEQWLEPQLTGKPWTEVLARSLLPRVDDGLEVSLKSGKRVKVDLCPLSSIPGQLVVMTDLTENRRVSDQWAHQQRLTALGKMMASLAHQVRTPLATALLYAAQLQHPLPDQKRQKFAAKLEERLAYAERQVKDMLAFARNGQVQHRIFDVRELFARIKSDLGRYPQISVTASELLDIKLNGSLDGLAGAIGNLAHNALDAVDSQSDPIVRIQFVAEFAAEGKQLKIVVTDNGRGIEPEKQTEIFEPFTTYKPNGNGLGLAVVRGQVIQHKGDIQLASEIGSGTTFTVTLPVHSHANSTSRKVYERQSETGKPPRRRMA